MKQIIEFFTLFFMFFVVPFILIWATWLLSGCFFSVKSIFEGPMFWVLSVMYWVSSLVAVGSIMDDNDAKRRKNGRI